MCSLDHSYYQELLKEKEQLDLLIKITEKVHSFTSLQDVYNAILDSSKSISNVDMVMVYLVDEEREEAVLQAQRNVPEDYLRRASRIPYPKGVTWKVINTGKVLNIPDAQKDPDIGPAGRDLGHHGVLGIPIFLEGKAVGVIWFLSYREHKFSDDEVSFLSTLGKQVAIAISKAKMIEDLRVYREQLIQAEKMSSLGRLTSSIAHEINNPLTPILGYSQLLLTQSGIDEEKKKKYLGFIYESAQRINRIIKGILSYTRKDNVEMQPVNINSVIEKVLRFREYQLNLNEIEVVKDLDLRIPQVMANPTQLEQVFFNIILNAEQALVSKNGCRQLVIRTRVKGEGRVEVYFSDNGPGISKEFMGKVFEPFFTTKVEGNGLGLFIVYEVIRGHNGRIWVESEEGKGATFIVELPSVRQGYVEEVVRESGFGVESQARGDTGIIGKRVLIVEDEELILNMIKGVLEEEGYEVDIASNGNRALEKLDKNLYDLIICDVKMPCMDGNRFYQEVRARYNVPEDKFIFVTGDLKALSINFDEARVLRKPFTINELKAVIKKSLLKD
jgi:signal transduction histidine kinase/CheY-like chemotaxis protein